MTHCTARLIIGKKTFIGTITDSLGCKRKAGHKGPHDPLIPEGIIVKGNPGIWRIKL